MKRIAAAVVLILGTWGLGALASPRVTDPDSGAILADTSLVFLLEAGNRLYPDWREEHEVRLQDEFFLGDTEFVATVDQFMSDFKIIDGKRLNQSLQLENPAVFVTVHADTGAVDSTWAFLNFPPHYSPSSFFTFQLKEIRGYTPPDTTAEEN